MQQVCLLYLILTKKKSDLSYNEDVMISPFFRHYFMRFNNISYFGEVFLGVNSGEKKQDDDSYDDYFNAALGVGMKYITSSGLTFNALGGLGRNMFTNDSYTIVPRFGVNIGYRF